MRATAFGGPGMKPSSNPATLGLVITILLVFLINWFTVANGAPLYRALALETGAFASKPWTLLTFGVNNSPAAIFAVFCTLLWLFMVGGQVERELGLRNYLLSFFGFGALGGLFVLGAAAVASPIVLAGTAIPLGAITMLWGARNRSQTIMFFGIIPMSALVLCVVTGAMVFLSLGFGNPLAGVAGVLPLVLAWFWASDKLPVRYPVASFTSSGMSAKEKKREQARFNAYMEDVRAKEQERREKDRLRELFERSLIEDPDDKEKKSGG